MRTRLANRTKKRKNTVPYALALQHGSTKFYILWMAIYRGELAMDTFWAIVIILVILWAVGFFANVGALIHILLVIAVIVIVYRLLTGRHILSGEKR